MENNNFFIPENATLTIENEYFMTKNDIFDITFTVKATKRYKKDGKFVKDMMVVEYRKLDTYEMLTYIYLCRAANNKENAFPSYNTIANKINCSKSKAIQCIQVLAKNGFIYKKRRSNQKEHLSNVYYINVKLQELKDKLDQSYIDKKTMIIDMSDNIPNVSDKQHDNVSDNTPMLSDGNKKEQLIKNNIKKEQYNNKSNDQNKDTIKTTNKKKDNSVVVDSKEINKVNAMIYTMLDTKLLDKDIKSIAIALKQQYTSVDNEIIKYICNLIKNSNKEINNITGYFLAAIKNKYTNANYKNNNTNKDLKFNNFDQREYDYKELERKLLGWECE